MLFTVTVNDIKGNITNLTDTHKEAIDKVLVFYGDKSSHWLSELVCQERLWRETRLLIDISKDNNCSIVIPKELIQYYYSGL